MESIVNLIQVSLENGQFLQLAFGLSIILFAVSFLVVIIKPTIVKGDGKIYVSFGNKSKNATPNSVSADEDGNPVFALTNSRRILLRREYRKSFSQISIEMLIHLPLRQMREVERVLETVEEHLLQHYVQILEKQEGAPSDILTSDEYANYQGLLNGALNTVVKHEIRQAFIINGIPKPGTTDFDNYCANKAHNVFAAPMRHISSHYKSTILPRQILVQEIMSRNIEQNLIVPSVAEVFRIGYDFQKETKQRVRDIEAALLEKEKIILYGSEDDVEEVFDREEAMYGRRATDSAEHKRVVQKN